MIGSIRLENEDGRLVSLDDAIEIEVLLPNTSFENTETIRIIVENRDESGEVTESYSVKPTSFEELDDETTKVTFTILGSYFTFGPVVLVNVGEEIEGYPENEDSPEPTPTATPSATPSAPTGLAGNAVSSTQVNLTWTDTSSNEIKFEIEKSTDNITYSDVTTKIVNSTSHSDTTVSASSSYYYRIRACNAVGCSAFNTSAIVNTPGDHHLVFVTSTTYTGDLGGLTGADAKCQARANAASLGGTWKAILSYGSTLANARITISSSVVNLNEETVADTSADMWDGSLDHAIGYDEFGNAQTGYVWTGSLSGGSASGTYCRNWDELVGTGGVGTAEAMSTLWIRATDDFCTLTNRLYCINDQ